MGAQDIVDVVGELVVDDGKALEQQHGSQALVVAQEMKNALMPYVSSNPAYALLWEQFHAEPQAMVPALTGVLQVILSADAALARRQVLRELRPRPDLRRQRAGGDNADELGGHGLRHRAGQDRKPHHRIHRSRACRRHHGV